MTEKKYPYPFGNEVFENRDIDRARKFSRELHRWVFVKEDQSPQTKASGLDFEIKIEEDTFVFVDAEQGVIKCNIRAENNSLVVTGGIYNPQKGTETLEALQDILKYVASKTHKQVTYKTRRINTTLGFENKLIAMGFHPKNGEYETTFASSAKANHQYQELDNELVRLGFLEKISTE